MGIFARVYLDYGNQNEKTHIMGGTIPCTRNCGLQKSRERAREMAQHGRAPVLAKEPGSLPDAKTSKDNPSTAFVRVLYHSTMGQKTVLYTRYI